MKTEVLKALQDGKEQYVSGEQLSEQLGVSRTMVWKIINQLKADGYVIESSSRKGYRLAQGQDLLSQEALNIAFLNHDWLNRAEYHESVDSTNLRAKRIAVDSEIDRVLIVSDEQTSGRGRLGRQWHSQKGKGLWASYLLRPDIEPEASFKMTLIAAVAVANAIEEVTGLQAQIKWPNDILIGRKKVCGILTEMSAEWQKVNYLVLGIGINVNQTDFEPEIAEIATSLNLEKGEMINRLELLKACVKQIAYYERALYEVAVHERLLAQYKEKSATIGNRVRVIGKQERLGMALGMDEKGALLVKFEDGTQEYVNHGEVSVRGIDYYA